MYVCMYVCTFDVILTSSIQYDKILAKFGQQ